MNEPSPPSLGRTLATADFIYWAYLIQSVGLIKPKDVNYLALFHNPP